MAGPAEPASSAANVPPPEAPPTAPQGAPPTSPTAPKGHGALYGAVATIVVIALLIVGLGFANVIPGFHLSPPGSGNGNGGGNPTPKEYTVTFAETGLPTGTSWSVTVQGASQTSATASISLSEKNGSYPYTVGAVTGYTASPNSGTLTVSGHDVSQAIAFTASSTPSTPTYTLTFAETGLPASTNWSVSVNGTAHYTTTASIALQEQNGTYPYTVGAVTGYNATPTGGSATVNGGNVSVAIVFAASSSGSHGNPAYPVTFSQSGLPMSEKWFVGVIVGGYVTTLYNTSYFDTYSEGASVVMQIPNGTYTWASYAFNQSYAPVPDSGSFTLHGAAVTVDIAFVLTVPTSTNYTVTFSETGLPAGVTWYATLNSTTTGAGAGTSIPLMAPNGTYYVNLSVSNPAYEPVGLGALLGSVYIVGANVNVTVPFVLTYNITVHETGLPIGTNWFVTINGSSTSTTVGYGTANFTVPNGIYDYIAGAVNYTANPANGTVTVNGANVSFSIAFTADTTYPVVISQSGLAPGKVWYAYASPVGTHIDTGNYSTGTWNNLSLANGEYEWFALTFTGYDPAPLIGTLTVNGPGTSVSVTFTTHDPAKNPIIFAESHFGTAGSIGLPAGQTWNVTLNGITRSTTGTEIIFLEPNGTYSYTVGAPNGYTVYPSAGTFSVNTTVPGSYDSAAEVDVAFFAGLPSPALALGVHLAASGGSPGPTPTSALPQGVSEHAARSNDS